MSRFFLKIYFEISNAKLDSKCLGNESHSPLAVTVPVQKGLFQSLSPSLSSFCWSGAVNHHAVRVRNKPALPWTLMVQQLFIFFPVVIIVAQNDFWGYRIRKTSWESRPYWSCCHMSSHGARKTPTWTTFASPRERQCIKPRSSLTRLWSEITGSCSLKIFISSKFLICDYSLPLTDFRHKYKKNCFSVMALPGQWLVGKLYSKFFKTAFVN